MADAGQCVPGSWDVNNQGLFAAINAYTQAGFKGLRAQALASMAKALENTQNYRAAPECLQGEPRHWCRCPYRCRLPMNDLRARQGFRVTGNTIDNDSATPRVCVQFSEDAGEDRRRLRPLSSPLNDTAPKALEAKGKPDLRRGPGRMASRYKHRLRAQACRPRSTSRWTAQVDARRLRQGSRARPAASPATASCCPSTARRGIPIVTDQHRQRPT